MSPRVQPYVGYDMDSTRWDRLAPRPGDIVISTPSKCGTTWTQRLVSLLVFDGPDLPAPLGTVSPWLDQTTRHLDDVVALLDAQTHRRFIKTHTPLDGLVLHDDVTYLVIGRDPRDAAVSLAHHGANMDRERLAALRTAVVGPEPPGFADIAPPPTASPVERFRAWIDQPWEPGDDHDCLAGLLHHLTTGWERRQRPGIALFHYADYQADLPGEMGRLADVLGIHLDPDRAVELAAHASLDEIRDRADLLAPNADQGLFRDPARFFRSGGRGEWRAVLTDDDLAHYDERVAALVPPDLAAWAHHGRAGHDPQETP